MPAVVSAPVAPAASAVRRIAPRFTGLLMRCRMTSSGVFACRRANSFQLWWDATASTIIPWGVFV